MRKVQFANGEIYHVYNRGVDHRSIVMDQADSGRFLMSLDLFNSIEPIGAIKAHLEFKGKKTKKPLVKIIAYCLNPNHFHLVIEQLTDSGISIFIKSLTGGYTKYFNTKHNRSGALFQGPFKVKHVDDNNYLLHLSSYVNLNNKLHSISGSDSDLVRSSWDEYTRSKVGGGLCEKKIVLEQFKSTKEYKEFALGFLPDMIAKRGDYKELETLMFD